MTQRKSNRFLKVTTATYIVLLHLTTWLPQITTLPQGAPETVCDTMLPFHGGGIEPANSVPPFRIDTSTAVIGQGQTLRVDITGVPSSLKFGGFMLQARSNSPPYQIIGQFNPSEDGLSKLMNCENSVRNSVTHSSTVPKPEISLEWQSPVDFEGEIVFNSTVAQSYDTFWVGVPSNPVRVVKRDIAPQIPSSPRPEFSPNTRTPYVPQYVPPSAAPAPDDPFYDGCGTSKNCFGNKDGCVDSKSCDFVSAVKVRGNIYEFELKSKANDAAYVALGLSEDNRMGNDLTIECVLQNGQVSMYSSLTSAPPSDYGVSRLGVPQNTARLVNSSVVNGVIYCKVEREPVTKVGNQVFDLINNKYYLLLAAGTGLKENGVGYHDIGRIPSEKAIEFNTRTPYVPQYVPPSAAPAADDQFYDGCGTSKNCFGNKDGCVDSKSCDFVSAVKVRGNIYEFELKSKANNAAYVALGLSDDNRMGNDLTIECIPQNGQVSMYSSLTSAPPNGYGVSRSGVPQNTARLVESSVVNGVIYCKVEREPVTKVGNQVFDLINNKYYLLLATGTSLKENGVGYHDIGKTPSDKAINLAELADLGSASKLLLRLHGSFMIAAWIGTTSLGIILARYFKQTWVGSQMCGKDQWFAWHRICMVTTWSLTMAAFVIIFVELDGWSGERNPHAILGVITTVLCFIQPLGALFRPAPNSKNRPIFNWAHWLGGNLAHLLAIVTIFFSVKLAKAELPEWMDWILVAYVAFHVIVHLIFSISGCSSDKKQTQRVNDFQMGNMGHHPAMRSSMKSERKMDAPFAGFRKGLLGVYTVVIILFVVALIVIVTLAPIEDSFKQLQEKLN